MTGKMKAFLSVVHLAEQKVCSMVDNLDAYSVASKAEMRDMTLVPELV